MLKLLALMLTVGLACADVPLRSKKGFVYKLAGYKPDPKFPTYIRSVNASWYYTWGYNYSPELDIPFTPMVFDDSKLATISKIRPGSTELLAFNEPDRTDQGNLTYMEAYNLWKQLDATGLRIGSVATAQNPMNPSFTQPQDGLVLSTSYFSALWQKLSANKLKPDFLCLHWYAPPNAANFLAWLDDVYTRYKVPIWVTEMNVADWAAGDPGGPAFERYTTAQIKDFMTVVVQGMYDRPFVERFAWKNRSPSDINMGNGALLKDDGTLTELGKYYATL